MNEPKIAVPWDRPSVFVVCQLLLLWGVSLVAVSPSAAQEGKPASLKIGFQNSPPYQFPDAAGLPAGPAVELMRAAAAREGIRLEWVWAPDPFQPNADRKSTRLNSSHLGISYAVFCLKK